MSLHTWVIGLAVLAVFAAAGAFAESSAYIFGLVGVYSGEYESETYVYEKLVGYYAYPGDELGVPRRAPAGWEDVELTSADFAASPFGFAMKGDAWRMSFVSLWNRHNIEFNDEDRQVNNATLTATAGYILRKGYFEDKTVLPYFGGFWRGNWTKAENVENGIIANGFGPDLGAVIEFALNKSFLAATLGFQYKVYTLTGPKYDDPRGDERPGPPHWNYKYIPEAEIPDNATSFYASARSSLQFHDRVGVEVEVRYDMDLSDSFMNGMTFAAGPNLWL